MMNSSSNESAIKKTKESLNRKRFQKRKRIQTESYPNDFLNDTYDQ